MERLSGKLLAIRKTRVIAAVTSFQRRHAPTRSGHQIQLGLMRDALLGGFLLIEAVTAAACSPSTVRTSASRTSCALSLAMMPCIQKKNIATVRT